MNKFLKSDIDKLTENAIVIDIPLSLTYEPGWYSTICKKIVDEVIRESESMGSIEDEPIVKCTMICGPLMATLIQCSDDFCLPKIDADGSIGILNNNIAGYLVDEADIEENAVILLSTVDSKAHAKILRFGGIRTDRSLDLFINWEA